MKLSREWGETGMKCMEIQNIIKGCKQKHACRNEVDQNRGYVATESATQFQCNPMNRANSVCRCCCETTECNENAEFCIKPPECTYPEIPNGSFLCENSGNVGDVCNVACNQGYQLSNGENTRALECGTDGNWNGEVPLCEPIPTTTTTTTTTTTSTTSTTTTTTTTASTTSRTVTTTKPQTMKPTERTDPVTKEFSTLPTRTLPTQTLTESISECAELETGVIGLMVRLYFYMIIEKN